MLFFINPFAALPAGYFRRKKLIIILDCRMNPAKLGRLYRGMRYNAACGIGYYSYTEYVLYFFRYGSKKVKYSILNKSLSPQVDKPLKSVAHG